MGNQVSVVDALVELEFSPPDLNATSTAATGGSNQQRQQQQQQQQLQHHRGMGILAFEVSALMHRALDIWKQLDPRHIAGLQKELQSDGLRRLGLNDYSFRWRLAACEYVDDLSSLTSAVAVLARRMGGARAAEVQKKLKGYSRAWRREQPFSEGEAEEMMGFLREQLEPMGVLHREMVGLDEIINSLTHDPDVIPRHNRRIRPPRPTNVVLEQLQVVQNLQRISLWNQSLEKCVMVLSVAVGVLWQQVRAVFGRPATVQSDDTAATVGASGLTALYARVLSLVDKLSASNPSNEQFNEQREELYSLLPTPVRFRLRKRLRARSLRPMDGGVARELKLTVADMLTWLAPLAQRTHTWHHERAHGASVAARHRTLLVETLHYLHQEKFEAVLVELLSSLSLVIIHQKVSPHPHTVHITRPRPPSKTRPPNAGPLRHTQTRPAKTLAGPAASPGPGTPTKAASAPAATAAGAANGGKPTPPNGQSPAQQLSGAGSAPRTVAVSRPLTDAPDGRTMQARAGPGPRPGPRPRPGGAPPNGMASGANGGANGALRAAAVAGGPAAGTAAPVAGAPRSPRLSAGGSAAGAAAAGAGAAGPLIRGPSASGGPGGPRGAAAGPVRRSASPLPLPTTSRRTKVKLSSAAPELDDIEGVTIKRAAAAGGGGGKNRLTPAQKQRQDWIKREVLQQGGTRQSMG